jgi:Methyltransferase domain
MTIAVEVLDIQQEMLDHTMRRAHTLSISNIVPRQGDAQALTYPDGHFDAAYLVATLGEVPQNLSSATLGEKVSEVCLSARARIPKRRSSRWRRLRLVSTTLVPAFSS